MKRILAIAFTAIALSAPAVPHAHAAEAIANDKDAFDDANVAALGIVAPIDAPDDIVCSHAFLHLTTAWQRADLRIKGRNGLDEVTLKNEMRGRYNIAVNQLKQLGEHIWEMQQRGRANDGPTCSEAFPQLVTYVVGDMSDTAIYNSQEVAQARKDDQDLAQQKRFWVDYARLIAGREKQKTAMDPQGRVRYDTQIGDYEGQAEDCKAVPTFDVCPTVLNVARSDKARKQSLKAGLSAEGRILWDIQNNDWPDRKEDCKAVPAFNICPAVLANSNGGDPSLQHAPRGWIGVNVQSVTIDIANSMDLTSTNGALVATIQKNSPAAQAGVQSGDVITAMNGETVVDEHDLVRKVVALGPKKIATVAIIRNSAPMTLNVTLGTNPAD